MHDTVARIWKLIRETEPQDDLAALFTQRLQDAGLSRALADPLSAHVQILHNEALGWNLAADRLAAAEGDARTRACGDLHFHSRQVCTLASELIPFLERAEDNLSEKDDVTHRESGYEREVVPFSRLDSTQALRDALTEHPEFGAVRASDAAQVQADLLKVVYLGKRIRDGVPKPGDLYALVVELMLDSRRHLVPMLSEESELMGALAKAAGA